jgi:cupin 2 domain-containing protein
MIAGKNIASGNLFAGIQGSFPDELISSLVETAALRIERIVSRGQSSPPDFWYDQPWAEWVVVLAGSAGIVFEGEASPRQLARGDHLHIPAHARHRVEWTDANEPTIWLAVHHR